jgi:hypothetical protein
MISCIATENINQIPDTIVRIPAFEDCASS